MLQDKLEVALERINGAKHQIDSAQEELPSENGQLAMCQMNLREEIERLESLISLIELNGVKVGA